MGDKDPSSVHSFNQFYSFSFNNFTQKTIKSSINLHSYITSYFSLSNEPLYLCLNRSLPLRLSLPPFQWCFPPSLSVLPASFLLSTFQLPLPSSSLCKHAACHLSVAHYFMSLLIILSYRPRPIRPSTLLHAPSFLQSGHALYLSKLMTMYRIYFALLACEVILNSKTPFQWCWQLLAGTI